MNQVQDFLINLYQMKILSIFLGYHHPVGIKHLYYSSIKFDTHIHSSSLDYANPWNI